jgi:hypothetical protein
MYNFIFKRFIFLGAAGLELVSFIIATPVAGMSGNPVGMNHAVASVLKFVPLRSMYKYSAVNR